MIRLNASHSKKVPGATEYSSTSFHASIEVEVSDADPRIGERLKALWADLVRAVDLQVADAQAQGQARVQNGNGNGHRANGNGTGAAS